MRNNSTTGRLCPSVVGNNRIQSTIYSYHLLLPLTIFIFWRSARYNPSSKVRRTNCAANPQKKECQTAAERTTVRLKEEYCTPKLTDSLAVSQTSNEDAADCIPHPCHGAPHHVFLRLRPNGEIGVSLIDTILIFTSFALFNSMMSLTLMHIEHPISQPIIISQEDPTLEPTPEQTPGPTPSPTPAPITSEPTPNPTPRPTTPMPTICEERKWHYSLKINGCANTDVINPSFALAFDTFRDCCEVHFPSETCDS